MLLCQSLPEDGEEGWRRGDTGKGPWGIISIQLLQVQYKGILSWPGTDYEVHRNLPVTVLRKSVISREDPFLHFFCFVYFGLWARQGSGSQVPSRAKIKCNKFCLYLRASCLCGGAVVNLLLAQQCSKNKNPQASFN